MSAMVVAEALSKVFKTANGPLLAVDNVSFTIKRGELFGLFGTNGAGKSTLVRMLSTLLAPTSGRALIDGLDVVAQDLAVRAKIGLVTAEERSFYGRLSAIRNLSFFAALQNVTPRQIPERVDYVLDLFGLMQHAQAPFQSLSTGQKQRLNMARALLHEPAILILDEPTKSMDVQTSDFVKELIKDQLVAEQQKTIVFISHELYEMDDFCDRVLILDKGQVKAVGTPRDLGAQMPRRAVYRLVVEGDAADIGERWRALPSVLDVTEISRGIRLTAFNLTLDDDSSGAWLNVMEEVGHSGGRVETYRRVDEGSLREIIKHFTGDDHDQGDQA